MKFSLWPKDATSTFEKALYAAMYILPTVWFLFMQLSAFQIFHNIYQKNVHAAGIGWHIIGFLFSAGAVIGVIETAKESPSIPKSTIADVIIILVLAALGLCSYAGFVFNG
jgi:hypothetical protein